MTCLSSWRHLLLRDRCAACKPVAIGAECQSELFIVDPQVTVAAARHRIRHHGLHFLRHHADKGLVATEIAETVVAKTVREMAEQNDVMFQRDVRTSSTATTSAATEATTAAAGK